MPMLESLLFHLSRRRLLRLRRTRNQLARTLDADAYRQWRCEDLVDQLDRNFDARRIVGKDVLDFGCGSGALACHLARQGARSVLGVDLSADSIEQARQNARQLQLDCAGFQVADDPRRIPAPDASFDLICCFDAMEHIMHPDAILREWRRVLRPEGCVWIWWSHWRHPYGHHVNSLIPLPWVHLVFSEKTLTRVAARIHDDPCYIPRLWDQDPATGQKKSNPWNHQPLFSQWLNKLTLRRFKKLCDACGFARCIRPIGFSGSRLRALVRPLVSLPVCGEFLTAYYAVTLGRGDCP